MDHIKALNRSYSEPTTVVPTSEKINEDLKQCYSNALQAKQNDQHETAIAMFRQILQNEIIEQITTKSFEHKQFSLKYCCYKNLAELHEAQNSDRLALEYFLKAYEMDNTDVYFMNKFGRVALQQHNMHLANMVFQRCLQLNSNHMPSLDGILEMLCCQEDYLEAYGWAIYCHSKCPKYQRAIDVIFDVRDLLKDSPLLQNAFVPCVTDVIGKRSKKPSLFPSPSYVAFQPDDEPDFSEFHITTPSFVTFGHMIKSIYAKSTQVTSYLTTKLSFSDICNVTDICDRNNNTTAMNEFRPTLEPFSEWCGSISTDPSPIQRIFQEILPQYFSLGCDDRDVEIQPSLVRAICQPNYLDNVMASSTNNETFNTASTSYLREFIDRLKAKPFHMLDVVFEWLKWMSKCSHIQLPIEMQSLYINIFEYQSNHTDWSMWDRLPHTNTFDLFGMAMFYIELRIISNVRDNDDGQQRFFDDQLIRNFHHILCLKNLFIFDCDLMLNVRLNLLHFQFAIETDDLELAGELLCRIQATITNKTNINLPNQMYCPCIDAKIIANEMELVTCLQRQKTIERHLSSGHFDDVVAIVKKYRQCNFTSKHLSIYQQFELILECLWCTDRLDDCLRWCEIGLYESMGIWLQNKEKHVHPSHELLQHVRFLTGYLEHLLNANGFLINTLNGSKERLVRSMAYLLEAQYNQHEHQMLLFDVAAFINVFDAILNSNPHSMAMENHWTVLNIITKVAEWLILNNIPSPDDGRFLMFVWQALANSSGCTRQAQKFHWTEIIRLLSHSIFGYPNVIVQHQNVCTCKRVPIDWNGAALLFTSYDNISNGMSQLERKSLIDDLLNTIPDDVQTNLLKAISQLDNFLNDTSHKCIPVKQFPRKLQDIFHRFVSDDMSSTNYGRYSREQLIGMDLVINPNRFSSWLALLTIKISQCDTLLSATDLTKINFDDVENLKNSIDTCFDKCEMLNRAETTSNVEHLWRYGSYTYKLCNFFVKGGAVLRDEFNGIYIPKRLQFSWQTTVETLEDYLNTTTITTKHQFLCHFMLGKIHEKQNPAAIKATLQRYLLAEEQLFDRQDDETLFAMKIEINFRITASIYKYITRTENAILNKCVLSLLLQTLKRDKGRLFSENQLAVRANSVGSIDENANQMGEAHEQAHQVIVIMKMCADDFQWYLDQWPTFYKAIYYLIEIHLNNEDTKCRPLLLQLPRKANDEEKKLSLFNIHRQRHLFKVKNPVQLDAIHDSTSFNKYMEKCVRILIKYLAINRNPYLQFVLAMQWNKLAMNGASLHLKRQQIESLFQLILTQFVSTASSYVKQFNRTTAKSKVFNEFFANLYELYQTCQIPLKTSHFPAFKLLMITCYRLCNNTIEDTDSTLGGHDEFQMALNYCAKKSTEAAQTEKTAKKPSMKTNSANKIVADPQFQKKVKKTKFQKK